MDRDERARVATSGGHEAGSESSVEPTLKAAQGWLNHANVGEPDCGGAVSVECRLTAAPRRGVRRRAVERSKAA